MMKDAAVATTTPTIHPVMTLTPAVIAAKKEECCKKFEEVFQVGQGFPTKHAMKDAVDGKKVKLGEEVRITKMQCQHGDGCLLTHGELKRKVRRSGFLFPNGPWVKEKAETSKRTTTEEGKEHTSSVVSVGILSVSTCRNLVFKSHQQMKLKQSILL